MLWLFGYLWVTSEVLRRKVEYVQVNIQKRVRARPTAAGDHEKYVRTRPTDAAHPAFLDSSLASVGCRLAASGL